MALSGTSKGGIVRNLIRSAKIQVGLIESPLMNCKFNPSIELCVHIPVLRTPVSSLSKSEVISLEFNLWLLQQRISCLCFQYHNYFLRFARAHRKNSLYRLYFRLVNPTVKDHYFCYGTRYQLDLLCLCAPPNIGQKHKNPKRVDYFDERLFQAVTNGSNKLSVKPLSIKTSQFKGNHQFVRGSGLLIFR